VEWLDALVFEMATRRFVFSRFEARIEKDKLEGGYWGEPFDGSRHPAGVEVKGPTFTELHVGVREDGLFVAQLIVDVLEFAERHPHESAARSARMRRTVRAVGWGPHGTEHEMDTSRFQRLSDTEWRVKPWGKMRVPAVIYATEEMIRGVPLIGVNG
jgi:hypothetical protein